MSTFNKRLDTPRITKQNGLIHFALLLFVTLIVLLSYSVPIKAIEKPTNSYSGNELGIKQSFNKGWLFYKGTQDAGESVDLDDKHWRQLSLPHDWAIEGPFEDKYNARNGGLPVFGTGWYRKHFVISPSDKQKTISLTFDGAMYDAHVYLNGTFLGHRPFGYIGFQFDLSPYLDFSEKGNVIAVRLSPKNFATRWYPGAGLYRNTWLEINDPAHIKKWGTYVTTPRITEQEALVNIQSSVINGNNDGNILLRTTIVDKAKNVIAKDTVKLAQNSKINEHIVDQQLVVKQPKLWDINSPYLYSVISEIYRNNTLVDQYTTPLGIRTLEFKPQRLRFTISTALGRKISSRRIKSSGLHERSKGGRESN